MSTYPNSHVFVVKVQNKTYLAFLLNQDGTRIKFFGSGEVIPKSELASFVQKNYHKSYDWVKVMRGGNPFHQGTVSLRAAAWGGSGYPTSIRDDIERAVGTKPSTNYRDYDSDNDGYMSSWKEKRVQTARMEKQLADYEERASQYPSFAERDSVTEYEICDVMSWYASKDKEPPASTPSYGGVLDF